MVKSKKMSKTGIAVIVLAILLVLSMVMGLTGAWFTDKHTDEFGEQSLTLGKIGEVEISVTGYTWTDGAGKQVITSGSPTDEQVLRYANVVMPGDIVMGGKIEVSYTGTNVEDVWYLILHANGEYTLDDTSGLVPVAETAANREAGSLGTAGIVFDNTGNAVTVKNAAGTGDAVALDGVAANNALLNNAFENSTNFDFVTITSGAYEIRVIQKSNLNAHQAYELLAAGTYIAEKA